MDLVYTVLEDFMEQVSLCGQPHMSWPYSDEEGWQEPGFLSCLSKAGFPGLKEDGMVRVSKLRLLEATARGLSSAAPLMKQHLY